jgi:hypothetical protein
LLESASQEPKKIVTDMKQIAAEAVEKAIDAKCNKSMEEKPSL